MKTIGLTPQQIQVIELLCNGKSITEIATELNINRTTIYDWQNKPTFQAYFNALKNEIYQNTRAGILSLYSKAIDTLKTCLDSENEAIKLKAAMNIIERVEKLQIEETNPIEMIKKQCTEPDEAFTFGSIFNQTKFNKLCKENNINPD